MDEILWLDLSVIAAALDRLHAKQQATPSAEAAGHAGDLQSQIDELTARRDELMTQLLDRLPGELAELPPVA
jgi:hypothetical protein